MCGKTRKCRIKMSTLGNILGYYETVINKKNLFEMVLDMSNIS